MHHFSFSSSPTEARHIEFTTRLRDTDFKKTMDSLPIGTRVQITEIHGEFIRSQAPDWSERIFFISGPPAMVEAIKKVLTEEVGITADRIKMENYLGY